MRKNFKNNLQINETERWWNSKNILKFDNQYKKTYFDRNVVLYQNSRMNKVYEFLNKEKFNNVLEIGFGAGQLMSKIIKIDFDAVENLLADFPTTIAINLFVYTACKFWRNVLIVP